MDGSLRILNFFKIILFLSLTQANRNNTLYKQLIASRPVALIICTNVHLKEKQ